MVKISMHKNYRCIPQNLSMSDASPFCQPWNYASDHPMIAMLDNRYFLSAYDRLRPGDSIRVVQMKNSNVNSRDNEVIAYAMTTVVKVSRDFVDLHIEKIVNIDDVKPEDPEQEPDSEETAEDDGSSDDDEQLVRRWNPGKKEHEVVQGDKVLFSDKDKVRVEEWLQSLE